MSAYRLRESVLCAPLFVRQLAITLGLRCPCTQRATRSHSGTTRRKPRSRRSRLERSHPPATPGPCARVLAHHTPEPRREPGVSNLITERDAEALKHLRDLRQMKQCGSMRLASMDHPRTVSPGRRLAAPAENHGPQPAGMTQRQCALGWVRWWSRVRLLLDKDQRAGRRIGQHAPGGGDHKVMRRGALRLSMRAMVGWSRA